MLKKIRATKSGFSNVIKQIPPESYKKFKIDYNQSNNININEVRYESDDDASICYKNKRIQNLFRNLQKDPKSIFYSIENLSRTTLNNARKSTYDKDKVFVNSYNQSEDENFY